MTDITESGGYGGGVAEREAFVFVSELVGMVDGAITSMAESCFVCRAEEGGDFFVTDITLDLHFSALCCVYVVECLMVLVCFVLSMR
ncbi:hypothetical protein VIGAN_06227000 [Vigna angularis var. angularis]|uniref:Uncharacterized protein n=1 Tax=Vigna angularis var. angularis TaxID=157739 RepID=A0A0S3SDU4_PHAAN|nr:hypothetical protein VIGAN_06227000 [Vigna angularis var. angularis]